LPEPARRASEVIFVAGHGVIVSRETEDESDGESEARVEETERMAKAESHTGSRNGVATKDADAATDAARMETCAALERSTISVEVGDGDARKH
jgi:hypothetical protein